MDNFSLFTLTVIILLLLFVYLYLRTRTQLNDVKFAKQSLSAKYGKMTEQFIPFLKDYPYDSQDFRFLGTPIDGIQFCPDKIVFIEFKVNESALTERQKLIREQIFKRRVEFQELRVK